MLSIFLNGRNTVDTLPFHIDLIAAWLYGICDQTHGIIRMPSYIFCLRSDIFGKLQRTYRETHAAYTGLVGRIYRNPCERLAAEYDARREFMFEIER